MNRVTMQNPFTEKLQSLLGQSNTAQITLANGVGKSSASISKILNGKSVPTPDTYRKIRDYLNLNEQDEAELDQAYILLHAPDIGKTKALSYKSPLKYVQERDLESCQYLDANKALLRRHVETILHELDLSFTSNHVCGARSADYLIHHNNQSIALICCRHAQFLGEEFEPSEWVDRFGVDELWYVTSDLVEYSVDANLLSVSLPRFREALRAHIDGNPAF